MEGLPPALTDGLIAMGPAGLVLLVAVILMLRMSKANSAKDAALEARISAIRAANSAERAKMTADHAEALKQERWRQQDLLDMISGKNPTGGPEPTRSTAELARYLSRPEPKEDD